MVSKSKSKMEEKYQPTMSRVNLNLVNYNNVQFNNFKKT